MRSKTPQENKIAKHKLDEITKTWLEIMYTDRTFFEKPINEASLRQIRQILDEEA